MLSTKDTDSVRTVKGWRPSAAGSNAARHDLRRGLTPTELERVMGRLDLLPTRERALLEAMFHDGRSAVQIATLTGEEPRTIRRQIRLVVARVLSPKFGFVMRHCGQWPASRRRVGQACVLWGFSARMTARELGITLHAVRRQLDAIHALYDAERQGLPEVAGVPGGAGVARLPEETP